MGTFFELEKNEAAKGGDGSAVHQLCPRYSGALTATAPTAMGNCYLYHIRMCVCLGGERGLIMKGCVQWKSDYD